VHKVFGHEEEIERAVTARDISVNADAETENDFAHSSKIVNRGRTFCR
jgi:hypothetical protein